MGELRLAILSEPGFMRLKGLAGLECPVERWRWKLALPAPAGYLVVLTAYTTIGMIGGAIAGFVGFIIFEYWKPESAFDQGTDED